MSPPSSSISKRKSNEIDTRGGRKTSKRYSVSDSISTEKTVQNSCNLLETIGSPQKTRKHDHEDGMDDPVGMVIVPETMSDPKRTDEKLREDNDRVGEIEMLKEQLATKNNIIKMLKRDLEIAITYSHGTTQKLTVMFKKVATDNETRELDGRVVICMVCQLTPLGKRRRGRSRGKDPEKIDAGI